MNLNDLLSEDRIALDFEAKDKSEAIGILVDYVVNGFDRDSVLSAIMEREQLGSTGVGQGVALPHVRLASVKTPVMAFGRSSHPIDFKAIDEEPCSLFFLILGPSDQDAQEGYLQTMAKISRLMRNDDVRASLMKAPTVADVRKIIAENTN